jgi:hypothetical protein
MFTIHDDGQEYEILGKKEKKIIFDPKFFYLKGLLKNF